MLIIGRAVAGMGGSGILNGAYGIIHSVAPLEKQPCMHLTLSRQLSGALADEFLP